MYMYIMKSCNPFEGPDLHRNIMADFLSIRMLALERTLRKVYWMLIIKSVRH